MLELWKQHSSCCTIAIAGQLMYVIAAWLCVGSYGPLALSLIDTRAWYKAVMRTGQGML